MKNLTFLAIMLTVTQICWGSNPADLTSDHRADAGKFYKIGYDQGPMFLFANIPYDQSGNISLFNWRDDQSRFARLIIAKQLTSWLDGAMEANVKPGDLAQYLAIDTHWHDIGMGVIMPPRMKLQELLLGPRIAIKGVTLYATIDPSDLSLNLYGATCSVKGFKPELALNDVVFFFRLSRPVKTNFGVLVPELRTKFTKNDHWIGWGLGFVPK